MSILALRRERGRLAVPASRGGLVRGHELGTRTAAIDVRELADRAVEAALSVHALSDTTALAPLATMVAWAEGVPARSWSFCSAGVTCPEPIARNREAVLGRLTRRPRDELRQR